MKVAVIGSRTGVTKSEVFEYLDLFQEQNNIDLIISGGASGVDEYAIQYADKNKIPYEVIRPIDYSKKINYLYRNVEIITKADYLFAFWNGESRGTKFVIDYAKARDKFMMVVR